MGRLDPERQGPYASQVGRAIAAMRAEPYLVGGERRDDTAIMLAAPDLIAKEGAEALDCAVSLRDGIGVAVKVADGGYRAAGPAMIAVLDQLGVLPSAARRSLRTVFRAPVRGGGSAVGSLEAVVNLSRRRA